MNENEQFIKMVQDAVSAQVQRDTVACLSLGMLTLELEKYDPALPVRLDSSGSLGSADSYRGYYEMLAFEPLSSVKGTVGELLAECRTANGQTYQGYKGGDYRMTSHTHVWVSGYGEASGVGIVGVHGGEQAVTIQTRQID